MATLELVLATAAAAAVAMVLLEALLCREIVLTVPLLSARSGRDGTKGSEGVAGV